MEEIGSSFQMSLFLNHLKSSKLLGRPMFPLDLSVKFLKILC